MRRALALLKTPPEGDDFRRRRDAAAGFPLRFWGAHDGDAVKLTGSAPSERAKAALAARAAKLFPGAKVDNGLAIASGASGGEPAAADWALAALAKLASGKVEVSDQSITSERRRGRARRHRGRDGVRDPRAGRLRGQGRAASRRRR